MSSLMDELGARALALGLPLGVHLDLTYRCNERCVHCYLDHEDHGEMDTGEILSVVDQLAEAGVMFLTLSGGEIFMRKDALDIVAHARRLQFSVKLKTNAVMVDADKARAIAALGVESVQISVYSHKPEVHDAITKVKGSFKRTIEGARLLKDNGVRVSFAGVLMQQNAHDYRGVKALAEEMGVGFTLDPTITPMMDGDRGILDLNIDRALLAQVMHDPALGGDAASAPAGAPLALEEAMETIPCSAGHTACYISPYGDVFPCVQFPLPSGNLRQTRFIDIWNDSPQLAEVRSIRVADLEGCSSCGNSGSCSRCPGLAYMEGNMRGPSIQDCEKSLARTGIASPNLRRRDAGERPVVWMTAG
ncbi:MAG: radical SAM protein [Pseudomonadota bacterium]